MFIVSYLLLKMSCKSKQLKILGTDDSKHCIPQFVDLFQLWLRMLHWITIPNVQTQSNRVCNFHVTLCFRGIALFPDFLSITMQIIRKKIAIISIFFIACVKLPVTSWYMIQHEFEKLHTQTTELIMDCQKEVYTPITLQLPLCQTGNGGTK
jgi:hypothetical protein